MTESVLQKLEERVLQVLSKMEDLRRELIQVKQENNTLRGEKERHMDKLQNLVSLLESMGKDERMPPHQVPVMDAVLLQG